MSENALYNAKLAYAYGVSVALQELGHTKEASDTMAVKEAVAAKAIKSLKGLASRAGGVAQKAGTKSKEIADKAMARVSANPAPYAVGAGGGIGGGVGGYMGAKREEAKKNQ